MPSLRLVVAASLAPLATFVVSACSATSTSSPADASTEEVDSAIVEGDASAEAAPVADASDASTDKAARCASTFGDALTKGFGRVDGTVVAIVQPKDTQCALPNNDHVIVQVKMQGAIYRMVVNVESDRAGQDPRVSYLEKSVTLPAPAWAEGWHTGVTLDYVKDFGAKAADFAPFEMQALSAKIAAAIPLDAKISVYSDTSGGASTHLVHRNDGTKDGAIVLDPDGPSPRAMLFRFSNQDF